ncbi:MAG: hypothetical protein II312_02175 [Lachnospiraceae bacterium]|nr:hypothetical protein [Lachnospiraceae bacterium]
MNVKNLKDVVQAYFDKFELINNEDNREYYKWEAFKCFRDYWDIEAEDFADMFKKSMSLTSNLINNRYVSPTNGIVKLAERPELTETIRDLFRQLYADDGGDIIKRQNKIENFRDKVNELLEKYEPGRWKYNQDFRIVMFYLNMYSPSDNYLFKATEAREFMYCIEYGDDFGSGKSFSLTRYYRMCDELVKEIKNTPELIQVHQERITDTMIDDDDYHILAFDIIYCAVTYGLYSGIIINKPKKKTSIKQKNDAVMDEFKTELIEVKRELDKCLIERAELEDVSIRGLKIEHRMFGEGIVVSQDKNTIIVKFAEEEKKFSVPMAFASGFLMCNEREIIELFTKQDELDKQIKVLSGKVFLVKTKLDKLQ